MVTHMTFDYVPFSRLSGDLALEKNNLEDVQLLGEPTMKSGILII